MEFVFLLIVGFVIINFIKGNKGKSSKASKIALQNYVSTPHAGLVMTDKELARAANSYLNKCKKSMERCLESMKKATTPKTYFPKMLDYEEIKRDILGLQDVWIGQFSVRFPKETEITALTNEMIDRYWLSCKEKSINAVSDKSKRNAYQAFFDTLVLYKQYMNPTNLNHIESYRVEFLNTYETNSIEISR